MSAIAGNPDMNALAELPHKKWAGTTPAHRFDMEVVASLLLLKADSCSNH